MDPTDSARPGNATAVSELNLLHSLWKSQSDSKKKKQKRLSGKTTEITVFCLFSPLSRRQNVHFWSTFWKFFVRMEWVGAREGGWKGLLDSPFARRQSGPQVGLLLLLVSRVFVTVLSPSSQTASDVPVNECTAGLINQVIIHDETFPFDYDDVNQFDYCLNATIVKENLAAIVAKVDQEEFQRVVLNKLREVRNCGKFKFSYDLQCFKGQVWPMLPKSEVWTAVLCREAQPRNLSTFKIRDGRVCFTVRQMSIHWKRVMWPSARKKHTKKEKKEISIWRDHKGATLSLVGPRGCSKMWQRARSCRRWII